VRLAHNWLRQHQRIERREGAALDSIPEPGTDAMAPEQFLATERNSHLWDEVQALSSGERTVVLLYYRDELGIADIARAIGVTAGTVKTLLFRARRHLRARLESRGITIDEETEE
jgi:RNA polymerase sigma-70 factor (ECF subfamily)